MAHSMLGWAQFWRGNAAEAQSALCRAVQMDPNNPDARVFLSIILGYCGAGDEGADCVRTAMRLSPHPTTFYFFALGVCRFVQERYEDAIAAFTRGLDLSPHFTPNAEHLIATYGILGRLEAAAQYLPAVLSRQPADAILSRWLRFFFDKNVAERFKYGFERAFRVPNDGNIVPLAPRKARHRATER